MVIIDCLGFGRSKKTAKSEAAKSVWNLLESTSKEFKNLPVNYEVIHKTTIRIPIFVSSSNTDFET